jgi:hypothetical protein
MRPEALLMPFVMQFILAFTLCLLLLMGIGYGIVRLRGTAPNTAVRPGVVESLKLSPSRNLVLIRSDLTEHLILVGGACDLIVETSRPPSEHKVADFAAKPSHTSTASKMPAVIRKQSPRSPARITTVPQRGTTKDALHDKLSALAEEIAAAQNTLRSQHSKPLTNNLAAKTPDTQGAKPTASSLKLTH